MVNQGVFLHTFSAMTGILENLVPVSQSTLFPPMAKMTSLIRPVFFSNSMLKIMPMAITAQILGR